MSHKNVRHKVETEEHGQNLYRVAGVALLISVGLVVLDIAQSVGGGDAGVGEMGAAGWFAAFQADWFMALRNLGLYNIINLTLNIPVFLALYQLHRKVAPTGAVLALALGVLGAAVYIANNRALAMLELSQQWAAASPAQKPLLEAAGTVMLAHAEDFTPGSFAGFFLSSAASLLMMLVMLRGRVFSRGVSLAGLVGTTGLLFFTISVTFVPAVFDLAMILAMLGGLLMIAWNVLVALGLFRLAGQVGQPAGAAAQLAEAGRGLGAQ